MTAGGSRPTGAVEGWSRAPLASRLPAITMVAAVGFGALVRPAAPFVFVGILVLYLFLVWAGIIAVLLWLTGGRDSGW